MDAEIEISGTPSYRLGSIIALFLMVVGAWDGILCSALSISSVVRSRFAAVPPNRMLIVGGLLYAAIQLVTGFALREKGKAGLWGLYVLGLPILAFLVYSLAGMPSPNGIDDFITSVLVLGLWFAIVRYFWVRRAQFTGTWRSTARI